MFWWTRATIRIWVLGAVVVASTASASPSAKLVYARAVDASNCSDEVALRRAVAHRLGYDPFVAVSPSTVVAEVRGEGEGIKARVFVVEGGATVGGARELVSPTKQCDELMLAVALAISIAIDPEAIERVAAEPPEVTSEAEAAPTVSVTPQTEHRSRVELHGTVTTREQPLALRLGISAGIASGPTPAPAVELAASFELAGRHWSIGFEPRWLAPSKTEPQAGTEARARIGMIAGTLAPCYRFDAWQGCLLGELGRLNSIGEVTQSKRDVSAWIAPGVRLVYRLGGPIGLSAAAKIDALYGLTRVTMILNQQPVFETERFLARLHLEAAYGF